MTSVTLLVLALSGSGLDGGAGSAPWVVPAYAGALGFGLLLARVERRAAEPMVPLNLLADRMVAAVAGTGVLVGVSMFSAISYVPLFVQDALRGSAVEAGRALTPLILGWVVMSFITGRVVLRVGYRPMVLTGLTCVTLAFFGLTRIGAQSSVWLLPTHLAVMGMGMGMTMLSLVLAMQNGVARTSPGSRDVVRAVHPQYRRRRRCGAVRRGHRRVAPIRSGADRRRDDGRYPPRLLVRHPRIRCCRRLGAPHPGGAPRRPRPSGAGARRTFSGGRGQEAHQPGSGQAGGRRSLKALLCPGSQIPRGPAQSRRAANAPARPCRWSRSPGFARRNSPSSPAPPRPGHR